MASKISALILKKKANLVEDAFFGVDRVIRRMDEYGMNLQELEILRQARSILGRISLTCDAELKNEQQQLKTNQP